MEPNPLLIWMAMITLLSLIFLVIPTLRLKRAIYQVIDIFKTLESSCLTGVKSIDQLGLRPPGFLDGIFWSRDFKPYALQVLIQENVIRLAENERLCLREEKVEEFKKKYRL